MCGWSVGNAEMVKGEGEAMGSTSVRRRREAAAREEGNEGKRGWKVVYGTERGKVW